jgi:hypothetical protein
MNKGLIVPIFLIVLLVNSCTQATSRYPLATPSSGIEGFVTEGPMCPGPVAVGNNNCPDKPYQATLSILGSGNKVITRFETDPSGYFKIAVAPGTYILHPESNNVMPHAADQTVVVTPDQFTQVIMIYDTGMR